MDVFYTPPKCISNDTLTLDGAEFHHATRVMRKNVGDVLRVVNGTGDMFTVKITKIGTETLFASIEQRIGQFNEPAREVCLLQAVLKNPGKMDWIAEKGTELGMARFIPMVTERSIARTAKKLRLEAIALAAMKQSCRCKLPQINAVLTFHDALKEIFGATVFLFHEGADPHQTPEAALAHLAPTEPIAVLIGPEGGFGDNEINLAVGKGATILSLGSRRLRSETAALSALVRLTK